MTCHRGFLPALLFALASSIALAAPRHTPVPGGIAILELPAGIGGARFDGTPVLIRETQGRRQAIVGLSLTTEPGQHVLELDDGRGINFMVADKSYPTQHVRIKDQGKVDLSPENEARVAREHAEINLRKQFRSAVDHPDTDFMAPAKGPRSGRFGVRRVFNGQARAPHVGLDFAVPRGAPILSAAAGKVLAVGDYFFNGKTVFVDHGQGLISLYCHLERIEVTPEQPVARGERLGAAGSSGRASGPHLHWSVVLNGAMIDPETLLAAPAKNGP
jgi:murein DD-endopeptidase MepM/ murein hydrolase activator NlpD